MKMSRDDFLQWENKAITLLGMSGVGKTTLANQLPKSSWFHYSADYRIGTKYLAEPIVDNIKKQAMRVDFLRELLLHDSIYLCSNITVHNLEPISAFLGNRITSYNVCYTKLLRPAPAQQTARASRCRQVFHNRPRTTALMP